MQVSSPNVFTWGNVLENNINNILEPHLIV
jgi:hypothetical protein